MALQASKEAARIASGFVTAGDANSVFVGGIQVPTSTPVETVRALRADLEERITVLMGEIGRAVAESGASLFTLRELAAEIAKRARASVVAASIEPRSTTKATDEYFLFTSGRVHEAMGLASMVEDYAMEEFNESRINQGNLHEPEGEDNDSDEG